MENEIFEKPFLEKRNLTCADIIVSTIQEQKKRLQMYLPVSYKIF
jgi:hypothetical protein